MQIFYAMYGSLFTNVFELVTTAYKIVAIRAQSVSMNIQVDPDIPNPELTLTCDVNVSSLLSFTSHVPSIGERRASPAQHCIRSCYTLPYPCITKYWLPSVSKTFSNLRNQSTNSYKSFSYFSLLF